MPQSNEQQGMQTCISPGMCPGSGRSLKPDYSSGIRCPECGFIPGSVWGAAVRPYLGGAIVPDHKKSSIAR